MAQYESEYDREDFHDIGDLVDNFDYSSFNNEDPDEDSETSVMDHSLTQVPLDNKIVSSNGAKGNNSTSIKENNKTFTTEDIDDEITPISHEQISDTLLEICEEHGIIMSKQMESSIMRTGKHTVVTKEMLRWFVKGYSVCLTSHILSTMTENMQDMKTEVKKLQISAVTLSNKTETIMKSADGLGIKVDEIKETISEKVNSALENIESFVSDKVKRLSNIVETTMTDINSKKIASETKIITPKISKDDTKDQTVARMEIKVPEKVDVPKEIGKHATDSDASPIGPIDQRKSIMQRAGFNNQFVNNISESLILEAIPPSLLSEIQSQTMTPRIKIAVYEIILKNLKTMGKK